jgi:hypothetical protein
LPPTCCFPHDCGEIHLTAEAVRRRGQSVGACPRVPNSADRVGKVRAKSMETPPSFEGRPQRLEHVLLELGQLVEEEHPTRLQCLGLLRGSGVWIEVLGLAGDGGWSARNPAEARVIPRRSMARRRGTHSVPGPLVHAGRAQPGLVEILTGFLVGAGAARRDRTASRQSRGQARLPESASMREVAASGIGSIRVPGGAGSAGSPSGFTATTPEERTSEPTTHAR